TFSPNLNLGFDLGFPGLNLALDGGINLQVGWNLGLGLGVSIKDGPYIDIDRKEGGVSKPELDLTLDATLASGTNLKGTLGFLQLVVNGSDANFVGDSSPDPTQFHAEFAIDLTNSGDTSDKRLSFSELGSLGA